MRGWAAALRGGAEGAPVTDVDRFRKLIRRGIDIGKLDVRGNLKPKRIEGMNPIYIIRTQILLRNYIYTIHGLSEHIKSYDYLPPPLKLSDAVIREVDEFFAHNCHFGTHVAAASSTISRPSSPYSSFSSFSPPCIPVIYFLSTLSSFVKRSIHPVLHLLYARKLAALQTTAHGRSSGSDETTANCPPCLDRFRLALAIEGGGMRGCVAAGMAIALHHLGFADHFDVVYGSSAGSLVGSFFLSRQLPYEGPRVYYKWLPDAGNKFINEKRKWRQVGFGPLIDMDIVDFVKDELGKPLLNLDYLLYYILKYKQPINWEVFIKNNKHQPLKIIASGLHSQQAVILDAQHGNFATPDELAECLRASMLLPGVAGPVVRLATPGTNVRQLLGPVFHHQSMPRFQRPDYAVRGEPMADAVIYEPVPYRSAVREGCSHVLVLRTRPDGVRVPRVAGIDGMLENFLNRRFLKLKNNLNGVYNHMKNKNHRKIYMEDMLILNEATNTARPLKNGAQEPSYCYAVAPPPGMVEITRTCNDRKEIYEGIRVGFTQAFEFLLPHKKGEGGELAKKVYSDERFDSPDEAAFGADKLPTEVGSADDASFSDGSPSFLLTHAAHICSAER